MTDIASYASELRASVASRFVIEARKAIAKKDASVDLQSIDEANAKARLAIYNSSMFKTLEGIEKGLASDIVASVFFKANVDAKRLLLSRREGDFYSVYAFEKDLNVARSSVKAERVNHYTQATLLACAALHKQGLTMTQDDAKASISLNAKATTPQKEKAIKDVRLQRHFDLGTASSQASSSINALESFNVIFAAGRDVSTGKATYRLNAENEMTKALLEALAFSL